MFRSALVLGIVVWCVAPLSSADTLSGRVVDHQNQPIAGARVDISTAAPKVGPGLFCPSCYLDCAKSATSDAEGKFELTELDPALKFRLLVSTSETLTTSTDLIDPTAGEATIVLEPFPVDLAENRILVGRVTDTLGTPISGALVEPCGGKTGERRWGGSMPDAKSAVTDADGRFRMPLSTDFDGVDVEVTAHGYPGAMEYLLAPGPSEHAIRMSEGTTVTGRLTYRGGPALFAPVAVVQIDRSAFDRPTPFVKAVLATTNEEGRFEFNYLPASEPYAIFSPVGAGLKGPVLFTALFHAERDGVARDLGDLTMGKGVTLAGRIEMPAGAAIPEGLRVTLGREPAWDLIEAPVATDGTFRMENLPPETYEIHVRVTGFVVDANLVNYQLTRESTIGVSVMHDVTDVVIPLRAAADAAAPRSASDPLPARRGIKRTITGVVVDRSGRPVPEVTLSCRGVNYEDISQKHVETSGDGRFEFTDIPDIPVEIFFYRRRDMPDGGQRGGSITYGGRVRPQPGESELRLIYDRHLWTPLRDLGQPWASTSDGN